MKKHLIFLCVLSSLLISCVQDVDDIFDKSAAERIEGAMREYEQVLKSNTNGWVVEYYPESGRAYGGFNLFFKFGDDNKVIVASELSGATTQESLYSMNGDMGPTLNFDTYNSILNYFSDPALNVGGGTGLGYEGDYEFIMLGGSSSEFILSGKKTKNRIRMTPLPEGMTWDEYALKVNDMALNGTASTYAMTVADKQLVITHDSKVFTITIDDSKLTVPYIFTPTGIKFYEPIEIEGQTLQEFTFDVATDVYNAVNANAKISLVIPPLNEMFANTLSRWYFGEMSPNLDALWEASGTAATANPNGIVLYDPFIGNSPSTDHPGTVFGMRFSYGGRIYYGLFNYDFIPDDSDPSTIKLTFKSVSLNGSITFNYLVPFLGAINTTFTMQADHLKNPTKITFTSKTNANIWFVVEL